MKAEDKKAMVDVLNGMVHEFYQKMKPCQSRMCNIINWGKYDECKDEYNELKKAVEAYSYCIDQVNDTIVKVMFEAEVNVKGE